MVNMEEALVEEAAERPLLADLYQLQVKDLTFAWSILA